MSAHWIYETSKYPESNVSIRGDVRADVQSMRDEIIKLNRTHTLKEVGSISQFTDGQYCCFLSFKTDIPVQLWKGGALYLPPPHNT